MLKVLITTIMLYCICDNTLGQKKYYGYENWSGRNTIAKSNIVISEGFVLKYNMTLSKGSTNKSFKYKISLDNSDSTKLGSVEAYIFPSATEAQLGLVYYLDNLATPNLPPCLDNGNNKIGDVAFGAEYNGNFRIAFTRNNVLILTNTSSKKALEIAKELDNIILDANEWDKETEHPSFKLRTN